MGSAAKMQKTTGKLVSMEDRAIDDLRFIRQTMARATAFTAVSGWGQVAVGATALGCAWMAAQQMSDRGWLLCWLVEAAVAISVSLCAMSLKARAARLPLLSGPGRKVALGFSPALWSGAVLTGVLYRDGHLAQIPGTWLVLYGAGVVAGGLFSVPIVPVMGTLFMALGTVGLLVSLPPNLLLAIGFGVVHIAFGLFIAWRHGG
jgi:hypothetical protein